MQKLDKAIIQRRKRLYSQEELAKILGCHRRTVVNLEARPLPDLLVRYLAEIGYTVRYSKR